MATDKVIKMLLQNLINIDLQNTENDSQNTWTKSFRDSDSVFATKEIVNHCLNGMNSRKNPKNIIMS